MQSLITQFEALKMQVLAFEAALKNTIPPSLPDPNNIIDPLEAARARARAETEARAAARVEQLRMSPLDNLFMDNRTEVKRLQNYTFNAPPSSAKRQLALIEAEIARIEGERTVRRRQQAVERKRVHVAEIRRQNPTLSITEVYRLAHKFPAAKPSKFALACAEVRTANPTLSKDEVWVQARMRLKVKECLPGLAALNTN